MEQVINKEQNVNKTIDNSCEYTAGPLNINRQTKQAKTVTGADIILDENDFEALDLLVTNEGKYLTFQQLYEASWGKSTATDSIDYAFSAINNIIIQINNVGEDFMRIENIPGLGYSFKTRWGQTWKNSQDNDFNTLGTEKSSVKTKTKKYGKRFSKKTLLTGAGTLVAAIILVFIVLYTTGVITPATSEPLYIDEIDIEDPNTPLAKPDSED